MEKIKVTPEVVIRTLEELVAENPDHVYEPWRGSDDDSMSCHYVRDQQPDCGIGQLLHRLGVPIETLLELEGHGASAVVPSCLDLGGVEEELWIKKLCQSFQGRQDNSFTWAESLAYAKRIAGKDDED
jgi:hypothetical protein